MGTHAFADMMYHLYQCFGLFDKDDKRREMRGNSNFSYHQSFFDQSYDDVIRIIDNNGVFSLEERRDTFYKYEQLYNAQMHIPVFSHLDNNQILKLYLQYALPPIVALDVYNILPPGNEMHFYYHIHRFLISTHCPHGRDDNRKVYVGVKNYLREYIRSLDFPYKEHLAPLFNFISDIKVGNGQREATIKGIIKKCRSEYSEIYLAEKNITLHSLNLDKIERAYLSLNVLLAFERQTSAVSAVSMHYRHTVNNGVLYNTSYGVLCRYLYSKGYDERFLHDITLPFYKLAILPISIAVEEKPYSYIHKLKWLVFNTEEKNKHTEQDLIEMELCFNNTSTSDVLKPYSHLLQVIILLRQKKLSEAYNLVNKASLNKLPIGYLPSAFAAIKLALKIKLERKNIRSGVLQSLVNLTLKNQGVITEYITASEDETRSPIILCANNMTIMRTVKMYNCMIINTSNSHEIDAFGVYPHAIFGLFDEIEHALSKLNILLRETDDDIESDRLADLIIDNKTLTARELNENLIGILDKCTLYNCLTSLNILISYLRCSREEMVNIIMFAGITDKQKNLRTRVREALRIASIKINDKSIVNVNDG